MAVTSGQTTFNLDLSELIEEAFERCGSQLRSGYDMRTARRSINLMTIEWANRGINLWTIEECAIPLVTNQGVYPVPADTIDILDLVTRTNNGSFSTQTDINLSRISESTYSTIPNKLTTGRPIQVWFSRQTAQTNGLATTTVATGTTTPSVSTTDTTINLVSVAGLGSTGFVKIDSETIGYTNINTSTNQLLNCWRGQNGTTAAIHSAGASVYVQKLPCVNIWPTPDAGGGPYTLVYWRMRRLQDAGDGVNIQDIPFRFINCFVAGLSYMLSVKLPNTDPQRVMGLKMDYEEQFTLAAQEDRETAPIRFVPRNLFYSR
jgi:hypothetical protein